ncbi:tyrosine-type recombinase/integrase [Klebsiella sp. JB_Kp040]|uniref:tyrosine-type recombinase/integrase n=1 Tax=unclassified Klebsiella TaxID=2608929 RepID=UPI0032B3E91B
MSIKGQAYLYKRKDGIWMFQIFVPKYLRFLYPCRMWRKTTSTRDLNEARRFRNHLLLEWEELKRKYNPSNPDQWLQQSIAALHTEGKKNKSRPQPVARSCSIPTLCLLRDEYAESYKDRRSYSTLSKSARAVELFLESAKQPDIALERIGRRLVTEFLDTQKEKGAADQSRQNWLTCLGSLYEFAKRRYDGIPDRNPFHGHNLEARRTIESYQPFTTKQLVTLVENAEEELQGVILIGLYSGMRLDEIASLKRDDIVEIDGIRVFSVTKSKTKAGIRCVPIHSKVLPIVDRWLSLKSGEYLLPTANRIQRADGKKGPYYSQAFTRLRDKMIPEATNRQCYHSLRGHFITCLDRNGVEETRIGTITGQVEKKAKTEAFKTYSAGPLMKELKQIIELVSYPEIEKGA